jgi:hypothetical protein
VVDIIVYGEGCNGKVEGGVDGMRNGNEIPGDLEVANLLLANPVCLLLSLSPFSPGYRSFCLSCSCKLDYVCDEEVAWDEEVEDGAVYDILSAIVMAPYAY